MIRSIPFAIRSTHYRIVHSYIKQRDFDAIRAQHSEPTLVNRILIFNKSIGLMLKQGYQDFKQDIQTFKILRNISYSDRTREQETQYQRISSNIKKFIPSFVIFNIPGFGAALFLGYMALLPTCVPDWLLTENVHNHIESLKVGQENIAYTYFREKFGKDLSCREVALKIAEVYSQRSEERSPMDNTELRMISSLLSGGYRDGTFYLTHLSPLRQRVKLNYFLTPSLSRWMITQSIKGRVQSDTTHRQKYQQISTFPDRLIFQLQRCLAQKEKTNENLV